LIERCENSENGSIVVALIDSNEVTLKRLRRKGDSIALEPANQGAQDPQSSAPTGSRSRASWSA